MTPQQRIDAVFAPLGIEVGLSATHLATGRSIGINPDRLFPTASVYKIPVMVEVYRQADEGRFKMSDRVTMPDAQKVVGSGVLQRLQPGLAPTIRDLVMLMIIISDNTATHMLQELVGSANVTATMRRLGLQNIHIALDLPQLFAHAYGIPADPRPDYAAMKEAGDRTGMDYGSLSFERSGRNTTTSAADMAALCALILQNKAGTPESCADMMTVLKAQQLRDRVPRYLPTAAVGNKTGTFRGIRNDAGLIMRGPADVVSFGLFTFDDTELPVGNSRLLAERKALVNTAMAEVGAILWEHMGV